MSQQSIRSPNIVSRINWFQYLNFHNKSLFRSKAVLKKPHWKNTIWIYHTSDKLKYMLAYSLVYFHLSFFSWKRLLFITLRQTISTRTNKCYNDDIILTLKNRHNCCMFLSISWVTSACLTS